MVDTIEVTVLEAGSPAELVSKDSTCEFYLGDDLIRVPVYEGDTSADIAGRIVDAMMGMPDLPVVATSVTPNANYTDVDIEVNWKDSSASSLGDFFQDVTIADGQVSVSISIDNYDDPQLDDVSLSSALEAVSFNIIVTPWIDPLTLEPLQEFARSKWGPTGGQPPIIVGAGDYLLHSLMP